MCFSAHLFGCLAFHVLTVIVWNRCCSCVARSDFEALQDRRPLCTDMGATCGNWVGICGICGVRCGKEWDSQGETALHQAVKQARPRLRWVDQSSVKIREALIFFWCIFLKALGSYTGCIDNSWIPTLSNICYVAHGHNPTKIDVQRSKSTFGSCSMWWKEHLSNSLRLMLLRAA